MKKISILIKPASSLCNLRCKYCFYYDVSNNRKLENKGIMSLETTRILIERIAEALDYKGIANISFQGGEPTIAGLDYFRNFICECNNYPDIKVNYSIQTNGLLIGEKYARFFKENNFLVGVSLDGYKSNMNHYRYDDKYCGAYDLVLRCIETLEKYKVEYNILTVVTNRLAKHAKALMNFYLEHNFKYIQLIPCLPPLGEKESEFSLKPKSFALFYKEIFDEWFIALSNNKSISINLFDNLICLLRNEAPYQCGMIGRCYIQHVIEYSGNVYPCDFYCLDEYCLGNIKDFSLMNMHKSVNAMQFLKDSNYNNDLCKRCDYQKICNGGCRRQNICYLSEDYCAYREVLEYILPRLYRIV